MAAGAAAHAAMIAQATKASGTIVRVAPADFQRLVERADAPVVVVARGGMFRKHLKYLTSYRGLAFFTTSEAALVLPRHCEIVQAEKIWIPD